MNEGIYCGLFRQPVHLLHMHRQGRELYSCNMYPLLKCSQWITYFLACLTFVELSNGEAIITYTRNMTCLHLSDHYYEQLQVMKRTRYQAGMLSNWSVSKNVMRTAYRLIHAHASVTFLHVHMTPTVLHCYIGFNKLCYSQILMHGAY